MDDAEAAVIVLVTRSRTQMDVYVEKLWLSNGLVIYSNENTPACEIFREVFKEGIYTPAILPALKAGDVVIDIGANIGLFSLLAARVDSDVRVYAFEPASLNFLLLDKNIHENRATNIHPIRCAVSATTGMRTLYLDRCSVCNRAVSTNNPELNERCVGTEVVESVSLDDVFIKNGIRRCNLLKVDVEGSEYDIFFSASPSTLARIDAIAMEYHDYLVAHSGVELAKWLENKGFVVSINPGEGVGMIYARRF